MHVNGAATGYNYDPNHNRLTQTQNAQTTSYGYPPAGNRLESIATDTVTQMLFYDEAGNLIQDTQGRIYRYNNAGRLKEIEQSGQVIAQYRYNSNGQRSHKITATNTTHYHYDLSGQLLSETDQTGNPIRNTIRLDSTPIAQIDGNGAETLTYLHSDHLNTARLATSQNQQIVWKWESNAFGEQQPQSFGTTVDLRFPGQYYDQESGLNYNYYRYYDPSIGRYITSDPIGLDGGLNTYEYALNNPIGIYDPFGLRPNPGCVAACTIGGGIIGGEFGFIGGGILGGTGGTFVTPEFGTVGGSVSGAEFGGAVGAGFGSATGNAVGQAFCPDNKDCDPPKGTVCYIIDRVPPSKPHFPITGSHYHLWKMNQAPDGKCFWNKVGASKTAPPGAISCPFTRPPR